MSQATITEPTAPAAGSRNGAGTFLAKAFVRIGVLPILLVGALIIFTLMSDNFLTTSNLVSALRQNSYIVIATLAQFVVLLSGGFDLSIGSITALVSVTTATAMAGQHGSPAAAIAVGILVGLLTGLVCGLVNALGVAALKLNPFIITLATASVFQGIALRVTSGVPVYGMPKEFSANFGFKNIFGLGVPVWIAIIVAIALWVFMSRTRAGRHIYAVGSNPHAAKLSGVRDWRVLTLAYCSAGVLTAMGSVLLTARIETGEANIGSALPLQTIAAAVIGGVSLRGGTGSVVNAILGAIFIGLVVNGMDLAQITSYYQMIVLGVVLVIAVTADRLRQRVAAAVLAGKV
ncbi:MAG: Ribose/xylose/arabinose/galactoside ABC-type transport system,permease component [Frankiales bacterium]|jgi:ribose/xylose/arabinose/galactoside ABC-type transport system permease subunit|nr:Ribose/xylose/arabinose/galactoside ABC-type transport system,permease component [Frankiales bacterium]